MKNCKKCWKPRNHTNPLIALCIECTHKKSYNNRKQERIKQVSSTNANTIAKFSSKIKAEILIRDKACIFCWNTIQDYHHVYYWWQAEYWPDRNNVDKGVWLCREHHNLIHHFTDWSSQRLRKDCIEYLKNYYSK